jgi:preprotein translocase subunit YajC
MFITTAYADKDQETDTISIQETQEQLSPPAPESSFYSTLTSLAPMLLIFVVFYFFLIRPQDKRRREKEKLISSVKKGEDVVTNSGIFGRIVNVNDTDNTIDLEIAENVEIKILKTSILDIITRHKKEVINTNKKDKGK